MNTSLNRYTMDNKNTNNTKDDGTKTKCILGPEAPKPRWERDDRDRGGSWR
jgi:hypothetical protein